MRFITRRTGFRAWVIASTLASPSLALPVLLLMGGCAPKENSAAAPAATAGAGLPEVTTPYETFDPARYSNPTRIDNPWMPLEPGKRYTYEGTTVEDDGKVVPHRFVINVTDMTKVVGGIRSVVTWDLDYSDGELAEAELAFYAQDDDGNVWLMGEYPEEYSDGKFVTAPTWVHGQEEARAGILMLAQPAMGTRGYAQGWGPKVGWTDRGKVDQVGVEVAVKAGRYPDAIVISETSTSEPGAEQLKFYARGVGNVKVGFRGGDKTKETLDLLSVETLDDAAMAEVRAGALKLEAHAYQVSPSVYGPTPPLEAAAGAAGGAGAAKTP